MKVLLRVVLIALGVWGFLYLTWFRHTAHVTSLRRYESVIRKLKQEHLETAHFPDRLPSSARDAKFLYAPGSLQGAPMLRLRLTLPPSETVAIEQRLRATQRPLTDTELGDVGPRDVPSEWLPADAQPGSLDSGSEFVSFLISPDVETAKKNWNHPANGGISVSARLNQVLYWLN